MKKCVEDRMGIDPCIACGKQHVNPLRCSYCHEEIKPDDLLSEMKQPTHINCALRLVVGSVAHIQQSCGCFIPGSKEGDPPGMTLREAANAAAVAFRERGTL